MRKANDILLVFMLASLLGTFPVQANNNCQVGNPDHGRWVYAGIDCPSILKGEAPDGYWSSLHYDGTYINVYAQRGEYRYTERFMPRSNGSPCNYSLEQMCTDIHKTNDKFIEESCLDIHSSNFVDKVYCVDSSDPITCKSKFGQYQYISQKCSGSETSISGVCYHLVRLVETWQGKHGRKLEKWKWKNPACSYPVENTSPDTGEKCTMKPVE